MRRYFAIALFFCAYNVHAMESIRVGSQLIVVGDSDAKVKEMLGKPSSRSKSSGSSKNKAKKGSGHGKGGVTVQSNDKTKGEKWQYRRDGHTITFIMADGKVTHIDDVAR
jgi:hypothetical protein